MLSKPAWRATSSWASPSLNAASRIWTVGQVPEARQHGADLRRHRMVAVAVPTHIELGLLAEVFEIGHGRNVRLG